MLYIDQIGLILGKDFREGLSIAPIMLMAYVVLGILFNVDMWYKLSGKTGYAIYVALAGLAVTIVINVIFMPLYSYHAAAWGHLASYSAMLIVSAILGRKYYPIPYKWGRILSFVLTGLAIYGISLLLPDMSTWLQLGVHTILILVYLIIAASILLVERGGHFKNPKP